MKPPRGAIAHEEQGAGIEVLLIALSPVTPICPMGADAGRPQDTGRTAT